MELKKRKYDDLAPITHDATNEREPMKGYSSISNFWLN